MKLSELDTEKGLDVLCAITPYVAEIAADEELMQELRRKVALPANATRAETLMIGAQKLGKITPILLQKKRAAILGILSAVNDIPVETLKEQNFLVTCGQVMDLITDREFVGFFKSYGKQGANA